MVITSWEVSAVVERFACEFHHRAISLFNSVPEDDGHSLSVFNSCSYSLQDKIPKCLHFFLLMVKQWLMVIKG